MPLENKIDSFYGVIVSNSQSWVFGCAAENFKVNNIYTSSFWRPIPVPYLIYWSPQILTKAPIFNFLPQNLAKFNSYLETHCKKK